jgi:fructokinase
MILVCGEALFDVFMEGVPAPTARSLNFEAHVGGSPLNVAMGLSRLGERAGLFTGVSTDFLGTRLLAVLHSEHVSTHFIKRTARPTTVGFVGLDERGAAQYAFLGEGAADRSVEPIDLPRELDGVSALHFGSYSLVTSPTADAFAALVKREAGKRLISIDPNVRPTVVSDIELWRERLKTYAAHADVMKMSDEDCELLFPEARLEDVAKHFRSLGAGLVVITKGSGGAEGWNSQGHVIVDAAAVTVVDTVGAGDTFQAALLARLRETGNLLPGAPDKLGPDSLAKLLTFAANAAAITCTRRGADLPRRNELPDTAL